MTGKIIRFLNPDEVVEYEEELSRTDLLAQYLEEQMENNPELTYYEVAEGVMDFLDLRS